eukprot:COSAG05_NODE_5_length_47078_cov_547.868814_14_plen_137_part_00
MDPIRVIPFVVVRVIALSVQLVGHDDKLRTSTDKPPTPAGKSTLLRQCRELRSMLLECGRTHLQMSTLPHLSRGLSLSGVGENKLCCVEILSQIRMCPAVVLGERMPRIGMKTIVVSSYGQYFDLCCQIRRRSETR